MSYMWVSRLLFIAGSLLLLAGTAYGGTISYMMWRESVAPSSRQVLVLRDGSRIPLVQPTRSQPRRSQPTRSGGQLGGPLASSTPPVSIRDNTGSTGIVNSVEATTPGDIIAGQDPAREGNSGARASSSAAYLPPLRLKIARIDVDWPVVLSNSKNMPQFKGIGWLMGSSYPGNAGNLVLYGHLDGPYATFPRLRELVPGDEFIVTTESADLIYQVTRLFDTPRDDVAVLAPTNGATATLITCSGRWDPILRDYSHRLIVTAVLKAQP